MGNLSQYTPQESETVSRIYAWHKAMGDAEPQRGYLGASIIGHECMRYLWYCFRQCVGRQFEGRLYRLFETGDLAEERFTKELRAIGCEVHDVDPSTGKQFEVSAWGGHFSGHMDGCALGIPEAPKAWHVLEFKTHNAKSFAKLQKEGVAKSKPMHQAQMQVYMGLTKMDRALYLAVNKDTDELYAERVKYDSTEFTRLMDRAGRIIMAQAPMPRITDRPDDFRCRFCDAKTICWGTEDVAVPIPGKTCRTCCHATPEVETGRWSCAISTHGSLLADGIVQQGCDTHLLLPGLISFADPTDAADGWIEFTNIEDGAVWQHGQGPSRWSTEELISSPGPLDGVKEAPCPTFGIPENMSLIDRYPWQDSHLAWEGNPTRLDMALESDFDIEQSEKPTKREDTDEWFACEFATHGLLVVVYKADGYAAIWRGKE